MTRPGGRRLFLKEYWHQIVNFTLANMKARYRKTFAGFLWVVINPIIMYSIQSLVFQHFLQLDLPNYSLFLLGGLLPWIFITSTIEMGTPVLQNSRELLRAFKIDPLVLVFSQITDNFFNFLFSFLILLIPTFLISGGPLEGLFMLPLAFLQLLLGIVGGVWFLSVFNVFYRDTRFVMSFVTSIFFFLTPIFYPRAYVPEAYRFLIDINPFYVLIRPFRACLYDFSWQTFFGFWSRGMAMSALLIFMGWFFWKRRRNEFYLYL